jgi:hypothetical protein
VNNIVFIEFYSKQNFPPGKWMSEPDLCVWENELPCLAIRDMSMGIWKGFVAINDKHPFYGKSVDDLLKTPEGMDVFTSVYGGLSGAGRLPAKYKEHAKNHWWIGIETSQGGDLMPLLKLDTDPNMAKMTSHQTYKDLRFIRREVNKLAKYVSQIK